MHECGAREFDYTCTAMRLVQVFVKNSWMGLRSANLRRTRDLLLPRLVSGEIAIHE
jgi:hypothetical protein